MKVIDLLNKIANEEEVPKIIKFEGEIYKFTGYDGEYRNYINYDYSGDLFKCLYGSLLNEKVEIIEDTPKKDKINELNSYQICQENYFKIIDKINEIIDRLNGEENE